MVRDRPASRNSSSTLQTVNSELRLNIVKEIRSNQNSFVLLRQDRYSLEMKGVNWFHDSFVDNFFLRVCSR